MPEAISEREKKLEEIRGRLAEYKKRRNDPYAYYPEEILAVREMRDCGPEDIDFLLNEIFKLDGEKSNGTK